jgi:hypothetical protein
MQIYAIYLFALISIALAITYVSRRKKSELDASFEEHGVQASGGNDAESARFRKIYFSVYGLAVAADWLQVGLLYLYEYGTGQKHLTSHLGALSICTLSKYPRSSRAYRGSAILNRLRLSCDCCDFLWNPS